MSDIAGQGLLESRGRSWWVQALWGDGGMGDLFCVLGWLLARPDQAFLRLSRRVRRRHGSYSSMTGRNAWRVRQLFRLILWVRPYQGGETIVRGLLTLPRGYGLLAGKQLFEMAMTTCSLSDDQISLLCRHLERTPFERVGLISSIEDFRKLLDQMNNSLPLVAVVAHKMTQSSNWNRRLRTEEIQDWLDEFWNALHRAEQQVVEWVWNKEGGFWLREFLIRKAHSRKRRQQKLVELLGADLHYALDILQSIPADEREEILGPTFRPMLEKLLTSPQPAVRQVALRLAGRMPGGNSWVPVAQPV